MRVFNDAYVRKAAVETLFPAAKDDERWIDKNQDRVSARIPMSYKHWPFQLQHIRYGNQPPPPEQSTKQITEDHRPTFTGRLLASSSLSTRSISASTMKAISDSRDIFGFHPSTFRALDASPSRTSTSAGR